MTRLGGALVVLLLLSVVPAPTYAQAVAAAPAPQLTVEQMKTFLKNAKVVRSRTTSKGVTAPKRLTLTDGTITHDAVFQAVDEKQMVAKLNGRGRGETTELNFVDSYRYNLAAYAVAGLLGLDHMMPVYVERRWSGQIGSISWFVPSIMDESERLKNKVQPPNPTDWNHQMYRMRVFTALTRDTDRNLTNVLISPDWKVVMIDFSRAFRLQPELMYGKDLGRIDRKLMAKLEALDRDEVKKTVGDWLTSGEMDAMMKRRDLLVAHFKKLIADVGEDKVLY
ncbi:MAG TPA: hypothetical protein VF239_08460 [Vicinamibacterales bacterium]